MSLEEIVLKYADDEHIIEKIKLMTSSASSEEAITNAERVLPDWVVCSTQNYSKHLKSMQHSWAWLCDQRLHVAPQKILIVEMTLTDPKKPVNYTLLRAACDILTKYGYCVRGKGLLELCSDCGAAILAEKGCNVLGLTYTNGKCGYYNKKLSGDYIPPIPKR